MKKRDVVVIITIMLFTPFFLALLVQPHFTEAKIEKARKQSFEGVSFSREASLDGTIRQKIDASEDRWVYYSFESGVVPAREGEVPVNWDMAFKRKKILSNSGAINRSGSVGIINLGKIGFYEAIDVPETGYTINTVVDGNIVNKAIDKWYNYNIWKHILVPTGDLYLIKTSEERIVKMKIEGYYCGNKRPACYNIKYAWHL